MTGDKDSNLAQELYEQGMGYDWRAPESASNTAIARAAFERAAALKHKKALREFSEMMFVGAGGSTEPEKALRFKFAAFALGDLEALEELSALLGSYAENLVRDGDKKRAELAAEKAERAHELLQSLRSYIEDVSEFSQMGIGQA